MDKKILVVGIPRSGYALTNSIIRKLINYNHISSEKKHSNSFIHRVEPILSEYLVNQYLSVFKKHKVDSKLLLNGEFNRIMGGPQWFVEGETKNTFGIRKYFGLKDIGDILLTHNFHNSLFDYYSHTHSHENPKIWVETPTFNKHIKITTLRNPAGILNSSVHSINALTSEYIQHYLPTDNETEIREEIAINKLSDLTQIDGLLEFQLSYFKNLISVQCSFQQVHWEDLIDNPISTIKMIAKYLKLTIPDTVINNIWSSLDHKNTFINHKHNFRENKGVVGDWKSCLTNEHIKLLKDKGFDKIAIKLGYPAFEYFNEEKYNNFQKEVSNNIKSQRIPQIQDNNLKIFSFNKSNIDDSKFHFKKFLGSKASITRFACPDKYNQLALDLLTTAETSTEEINCILRNIDNSKNAEEAFQKSSHNLKKMAQKANKINSYLTAKKLNKNFYINCLNKLIKLSKNKQKFAIWGVSQDFDNLINSNLNSSSELLKHPNLQLFDMLEANNIIHGKRVESSDELKTFDGVVVLIPFSVTTRTHMKNIAKKQNFFENIWDIYETE